MYLISDLVKRSQTIWGYGSANCTGAPTILWNSFTSGCYHYTDTLGTSQPLLSLLVHHIPHLDQQLFVHWAGTVHY